MSIYHMSVSVISRGSGHSAMKACAYRSGADIYDRKMETTHCYSNRSGVISTEIIAPAGSPSWVHDRAELWNKVEACEKRKDSQLAREIVVALPHEASALERSELVNSWVKSEFVDRGMVADICIHAPSKEGDQRNHHAHVMLTTREINLDGFGKKCREWNDKNLINEWRVSWEKHHNELFPEYGIDSRSLESQGVIDRTPTIHMGKSATNMERREILKAQELDVEYKPITTNRLGMFNQRTKDVYLELKDRFVDLCASVKENTKAIKDYYLNNTDKGLEETIEKERELKKKQRLLHQKERKISRDYGMSR